MDRCNSLNEYEKLVILMKAPRVVIDNAACPDTTLIKVDSARNNWILLETVQLLSGLNFNIHKGYISTDSSWLMIVFHVTNKHGKKLLDESLAAFLEQSLNLKIPEFSTKSSLVYTTLELTGSDRPGLLSEIYAVLSDLNCSIVKSKVWTNCGRMASILYLEDTDHNGPAKIEIVMKRMNCVLRGGRAVLSEVKIENVDRRLRQIMHKDEGFERGLIISEEIVKSQPSVLVQNWKGRGYSIVSVQCRDRLNLLFDVVCGLTDLDYVVFHASIDTGNDHANLDFYVKHMNRKLLSSEEERQRLIQCLQIAIERRATNGLVLKLRARDEKGLLAKVTRTFRENGLSVHRAEILTKDSMAADTFCVTTVAGQPVDYKTINTILDKVGLDKLKVVKSRRTKQRSDKEETKAGLNYLCRFVMRILFNFGLIRSFS